MNFFSSADLDVMEKLSESCGLYFYFWRGYHTWMFVFMIQHFKSGLFPHILPIFFS